MIATTSAHALSVELVGIPGSGKSRLARMLAQQLGERGIAVTQPQEPFSSAVPAPLRLARKALACSSVAIGTPITAARLIRGLMRSRQPNPRDLAGRSVQLLLAQDVANRAARGAGVTIVDEGVVQSLWSIGLRGDVSPVLAALEGPGSAPLADLLVVVQVPVDLALSRLGARASQHSRTQLLGEDAREAELHRGAELIDMLVDWWSQRTGGHRTLCVTSDPEEECETSQERLVKVLVSRLESGW